MTELDPSKPKFLTTCKWIHVVVAQGMDDKKNSDSGSSLKNEETWTKMSVEDHCYKNCHISKDIGESNPCQVTFLRKIKFLKF